MKEYKNDSADTLARFGRDKRARIVKVESERVQRETRPRRESEERVERPQQERRRSFNPNFGADNKPARSFTPRSTDRRETFSDRKSDSGFGRKPAAREFGAERKTDFRGEHKTDFRGERKAEFRPERKAASKFAGDRNDRYSASGRDGGSKFPKPRFRSEEGRPSENKSRTNRSAQGSAQPKPYPKYRPAMPSGEIRLNRFIAQSGLCSRREADDYITAGVVTVNGRVVTELGTKVLPTDDVRFNDEPVRGEQNVYLLLNKPKGYVTTLEDPHASKIVTDLVRNACKERIYPVGRLDKNSVGLLLFTNDGDLTKQLTHPSYRKKKVYQVTLDKPLSEADMDRIANGIELEDGEIYADEIACLKDNRKEIGIEIHSGRNRIVRRIFEHLGYEVQKLDRVYYAGLTKKNLKRGAWRFLTKDEVTRLKSGMYE